MRLLFIRVVSSCITFMEYSKQHFACLVFLSLLLGCQQTDQSINWQWECFCSQLQCVLADLRKATLAGVYIAQDGNRFFVSITFESFITRFVKYRSDDWGSSRHPVAWWEYWCHPAQTRCVAITSDGFLTDHCMIAHVLLSGFHF